MSAKDMLNFVIELFFTVLTLITFVNYVRFREGVRRDVALLFFVIGFPFIELLISYVVGQPVPTWAGVLGIAVLMVEPYALLRVIRYLRPITVMMMRLALYGMLISVFSVIVFNTSLPALLALVLQVYFVGINLYASVLFVRGALKQTGVARQRLRFAALGSLLFALVLTALVLAGTFPSLGLVAQGLEIASAICFYVGFLPPRWLRRLWQLSELGDYLSQLSDKPMDERLNIDEIMSALCSAATRAVDGMASAIVRKDAADQPLALAHVDGDVQLSAQDVAALQSLWDKGTALALHRSTSHTSDQQRLLTAVGADTLLLAPISTLEGTWGLLVVFLRNTSLFLKDDLHFVSLLAQQNALFLANSGMIKELRKLNAELGMKANQLVLANRELEAFSYSVSHDLRSPLRALDGYSQALTEDCAEQLDEQGRAYITRIRANSQRMSQLIDGLLELSRWTRSELRHEQVDLSALAQHIAAELREQQPDRVVELEIEAGIVVEGDTRLLRVALTNLLNNAWKYTAKQPKAYVKFGVTHKDDTPIYHIRDNGAGFNMAYADKLFGTFQRLHSTSEFPGNGIGLATVQRIIHRHGGDIWAESVVGQGATFHFTLTPPAYLLTSASANLTSASAPPVPSPPAN